VNVTDLRDMLDERSAAAPDSVPHAERMDAIRRGVRRLRGRRASVAGAFAVLAVVIGYALGPFGPVGRGGPAGSVDGFPEYAEGGRVVASRSAPLASGEITLSVTVPGPDTGYRFTGRCTSKQRLNLRIEVDVDGIPERSLGRVCDGSLDGIDATPSTTGAWKRRVASGTQITVRFTLRAALVDRPLREVSNTEGTFAVAVYQAVAFADYPLPPRPKTLRPLPPGDDRDGRRPVATVRADPAHPDRRQEITVDNPHADMRLEVTAATPGILHIFINGREVDTRTIWDYQAGIRIAPLPTAARADLTPERLTISIVPEHMTGDWRVIFLV
jgi:hypothetical protein